MWHRATSLFAILALHSFTHLFQINSLFTIKHQRAYLQLLFVRCILNAVQFTVILIINTFFVAPYILVLASLIKYIVHFNLKT